MHSQISAVACTRYTSETCFSTEWSSPRTLASTKPELHLLCGKRRYHLCAGQPALEDVYNLGGMMGAGHLAALLQLKSAKAQNLRK